ncbi:MAG: hypothetical protein IJB24_01085 [Clostridia bacterium]|nr:hypothetical protein [Clostridia bacterium]
MTVNNLIEKLDLEVLNLAEGDREITGGYVGDLLSWVMGKAESGDMWVTIMTNINVVAVASLVDIACVVIADKAEIDPEVIEKARVQGINLLRSAKSAYQLCNEQILL